MDGAARRVIKEEEASDIYTGKGRSSMDITATGRSISGNLYQQKGAGARAQGAGYLKAAQEAGSRLEQREPNVLNITMVTDPATGITYGCAAGYSEDSTAENPIIQVTMSGNGKKEVYEIAVREVNPSQATGLEMFALCCYADDQGIGMGGLGSWVKVKAYMENAVANGYQQGFSGKDAFVNQKLDWQAAVSQMGEEYLKAGIYQQYQQGKVLLDMMDHFTGRGSGEADDPWQVIAARKDEIKEKLRNGDTEVKYQIGDNSYTQKEWERMMEQFDSLEEAIRSMMEERREKQRQYAFRQILTEPEKEKTTS